MALVENRSTRPIRAIVCRIQPNPAPGFDWEAAAVGGVIPGGMPPVTEYFYNPVAGGRAALLRPGGRLGFKFPIPVDGKEET